MTTAILNSGKAQLELYNEKMQNPDNEELQAN